MKNIWSSIQSRKVTVFIMNFLYIIGANLIDMFDGTDVTDEKQKWYLLIFMLNGVIFISFNAAEKIAYIIAGVKKDK